MLSAALMLMAGEGSRGSVEGARRRPWRSSGAAPRKLAINIRATRLSVSPVRAKHSPK